MVKPNLMINGNFITVINPGDIVTIGVNTVHTEPEAHHFHSYWIENKRETACQGLWFRCSDDVPITSRLTIRKKGTSQSCVYRDRRIIDEDE